jgi:hypothetical protein
MEQLLEHSFRTILPAYLFFINVWGFTEGFFQRPGLNELKLCPPLEQRPFPPPTTSANSPHFAVKFLVNPQTNCCKLGRKMAAKPFQSYAKAKLIQNQIHHLFVWIPEFLDK